MDRAAGFYPVGWEFESLRGRREFCVVTVTRQSRLDNVSPPIGCPSTASGVGKVLFTAYPEQVHQGQKGVRFRVKFKKGDTVIYPQHGACIVVGTRKMEAFGSTQEYLILKTVINEMTLSVPTLKASEVGVRPPVNPEELEDLVAVLSKPDPRVPSNWSRRFKNHQEKLKSGDVYQVAEVVRNLAARNRDASLSAAERTMYDLSLIHISEPTRPY